MAPSVTEHRVLIALLLSSAFMVLEAQSRDSVTACEKACKAADDKDPEVIRALIQKNEPLCDCRCACSGETPLHGTVATECTLCAELLTQSPSHCFADRLNFYGNSPLLLAATICQSPMTNTFLNAGADPNLKNYRGMSPLCLAASLDSDACGGVIQDLVVKGGADICQKCNGKTPLELATYPNNINVIIQQGGDKCE